MENIENPRLADAIEAPPAPASARRALRRRERGMFTHAELAVLACIGEETDEDGWATISKRELSSATGFCMATIDRAVRDLRRSGLLVSRSTSGSDGGQKANTYMIV